MFQTNFKTRTVARQTREDSVSDSIILVNELTVVMEVACTWQFLFDKISSTILVFSDINLVTLFHEIYSCKTKWKQSQPT